MKPNKSKLLIVITLLYLLSQAVLLATVGKDLSLILLSLGVFASAAVLTLVWSEGNFGRVKIESVSDRRLKRSAADQANMVKAGYVIDKEFVNQSRFAITPKSKPYSSSTALTSTAQPDDSVGEKSVLEKVREAIEGQLPMFGGIEKLSAMVEGMDNATIQKMLKRMGYQQVSADEVRGVVAEMLQQTRHPVVQSESTAVSYRVKTSLDIVSFYDYIKRCMSGNDQETLRQGPPQIIGSELLDQIASSGATSAKTLARMRGVHKGGGVQKCEKCQRYSHEDASCTALSLPVAVNDVCDNWTPNAMFKEFDLH
jgi:hypothetical protein